MNSRAVVLRGDAAHLPLPDGSVDLIVTSPPYFGLRSYSDGGGHYDGQIGSEATPAEYLEALWGCTAEWVRCLKPEGSLFINLGDSYYSGKGAPGQGTTDPKSRARDVRRMTRSPLDYGLDYPRKSLLGLPWRYAIGCTDRLGLILRAEIVWQKPNGLPESVTDRVRRAHEQVFHFTRLPRYYAAVDEIREAHIKQNLDNRSSYAPGSSSGYVNGKRPAKSDAGLPLNPLGKLPGSVWTIPSQPLAVPAHLGVDHFAAFPMELPRRIILGWSPSGICLECGEGRRPVTVKSAAGRTEDPSSWSESVAYFPAEGRRPISKTAFQRGVTSTIIGYACACTPYTDHPGTTGRERTGQGYARETGRDAHPHGGVGVLPRTGPWREYHLEGWVPPPARPAVVVDPFGGTGTTALVAAALGRTGITVDRSMDYARLARWRTSDPGEQARALGVPKPPGQVDGQGDLFSVEEATA